VPIANAKQLKCLLIAVEKAGVVGKYDGVTGTLKKPTKIQLWIRKYDFPITIEDGDVRRQRINGSMQELTQINIFFARNV